MAAGNPNTLPKIDIEEESSDFLKELSSDEEVVEEKEEKEEEEKEELEEKEEESQEELEVSTNLTELGYRPTIQEITKEFPELFKKFPDLRSMYFREAQYSEIFHTIEDAKQASTDLESLQSIENSLSGGKLEDTVGLLDSVKEMGENSLHNLSINILPALQKVDSQAFFNAITPELVRNIRYVYDTGDRYGQDNIKNAAIVMAHVLFKDGKIATGETQFKTPELKVQENDKGIDNERKQLREERYNLLYSDVATEFESKLLQETLTDLDPDNVMSKYTKDLLANDICRKINNALKNDKAHMANMKSLWTKASTENFSSAWKDRLLTAALSRAKSIMPTIRKKLRAEALSTTSKRSENVADNSKQKNHPLRTGGGSEKSSKVSSAKELDEKNISDLEFLSM